MRNDYLWDGSGEPDPEIQALEKALAAVRYRGTIPAMEFESAPVCRDRTRSPVSWRISLALALIVLTIGGWLWYSTTIPAYVVVSLDGAPQVGFSHLGESGLLKRGQWLQTDSGSRARIQIGSVGQVDIEPDTRVRLIQAKAGEHRLLLQRGSLHATIWAPPRRFFVDTPYAEAEDLGCAYTLEVRDDGTGFLQVSSGWVAFKHEGRESFVPAGAVCLTYPEHGPGTPYRSDAAAALRKALASIDRGADSTGESVAALLAEVRPEDAFTLWHLLPRIPGADRARICDRLTQLVPMPAGVTRQGILAGDPRMLDQWWDALGLGTTGWWRLWERPWQNDK